MEHEDDSDKRSQTQRWVMCRQRKELLGRAPGIYERSPLLFFSCSVGRPCEPDVVEACLALASPLPGDGALH